MFVRRNENKHSKTYSFPLTKLKNVYCTHCKHQFFLQGFIPLQGTIPLLMECGHVLCEKCAKLNKPCLTCNVTPQPKDGKNALLPLHIYTLGLMVSSHNRPIDMDDSHISFTKSSNSRLRQQCAQGLCQECGFQASIKCPQCDALYCNTCYAKIHGRALNSHSKIVLSDSVKDDSCIVQNICSEKCNEVLGYYCDTCDLAGCSHCMLKTHKAHNYVPLLDKNHMFLAEFRTMYNNVGIRLQRIRQAQKILKSKSSTPMPIQNVDNVETLITQHFAHLHGVLQNMERKMMDSLHEKRDSWIKNIDDISMQLKEHEDRLQTAFLVIGSVEENLDKIDIQRVIKKLKKITDIPCHLLETSESPDADIRFDVDQSIVDTMQNHCAIRIPAVSSFSLERTELLPDDYEMEPLEENISIPRSRDRSLTETKSSSLVPLQPQTTDSPSELFSTVMVRVTHVIDPFCFYVQLVQDKDEIAALQQQLNALENTSLIGSADVKINALYAVQCGKDEEWYRGRVVSKKTYNNDERYTLFLIDNGRQEQNVPLTKMRKIAPAVANLPVMARRCSLVDVVPNGGTWNNRGIEAFKSLLNSYNATSINILRTVGDTYYVDMYALNNEGNALISAKEMLTFMKHATCISSNKLMRINPYSTRAYYKEELLIDAFTQCEILFVESPSSIYVRKKYACRTQFSKMAHEMMETYEQKDPDEYITSPCKDLPCAARDTGGHWRRGLIREVTENTVKVFFVDLGYSLILDYGSIKMLSKNFLSHRTQAIKLSLRNVKPLDGSKGQWESATIEFLKKILKTSMTVKVVPLDKFEDTYSASVQIDEGDISQLLIKNKLALGTKISPSTNKMGKNMNRKCKKRRNLSYVQDSVHTSTLDVQEQLRQMSKSFSGGPSEIHTTGSSSAEIKEKEDPFKVQVILHQVKSPDCIYVSDAAFDRGNMDQMSIQMQKFYGNYRSADKEVWKEGAVCAVLLSKNNMYYRGIIVEMKANDQAVVCLYDLGLEETVSLNDLQALYPPFHKVPAYGFKIKLAGILPCGGSTKWPSLSCRELEEITTNNYNCQFYISKLEDEDLTDSAIPVELWIKQNKVDGPLFPTRIEINSVNRMLVEKGVALPIKEYAKKRDKVLAVELKIQLMKKLERLTKKKSNVKWCKIDDNNFSNETDTNAEPTTYAYSNSSSESLDEYNMEEEFDNIPSLPKLTAWLPAEDISENTFIATPTYLDNDGFLYLHSVEKSTRILSDIERKLEHLYTESKIESCDTVWSIGDMCIAQYHDNKKWYRGKVVKWLENDMIEVEFVDYGNVEECPLGTLQKHVVLENIPIQCTKCLIYGLIPDNTTGKWTTLELDKIHGLLIDKKCIVSILERTDAFYIISIKMFLDEQKNITKDLISFLIDDCDFKIKPNTENTRKTRISVSDISDVAFETSKMLLSDEETDETLNTAEQTTDKVISGFSTVFQQTFTMDNNNDCSITTTDVENLSWSKGKENLVASTPYVVSEETLVIGYESITVPKNIEYMQIELCCSISATKFYAQLKENTHSTILNTYYTRYIELMAELQENASKQPMITTIAPNIPCCAKFGDNIWYRCLITEASAVEDSDDIEVKLLYVDYGNDEYRTVNPQKSELYSLKKEWIDVQTLSMKCKLWNVEVSSSANKNVILPEIEKMYEKVVIATVKDADEEFMSVELYENEDRKELLYSSLIKEGLFKVIAKEPDELVTSISE